MLNSRVLKTMIFFSRDLKLSLLIQRHTLSIIDKKSLILSYLAEMEISLGGGRGEEATRNYMPCSLEGKGVARK